MTPAARIGLTPALVTALLVGTAVACAPDDSLCDLEPTSEPVEIGVTANVVVETPPDLADLGGDGIYAGPQLEPLDHGGIIWVSPEVVADTFVRRPVYLTVDSSEAAATLVDPLTLQLTMTDGSILTLRAADCAGSTT